MLNKEEFHCMCYNATHLQAGLSKVQHIFGMGEKRYNMSQAVIWKLADVSISTI